MFKKISISLFLFFITINSYSYAYSNGFLYMVKAMNIETVNVSGLTLNEDIYNKYKLMVYGSPLTVNSSSQRWKEVQSGNWTYNGGAWNGSGVRGEYWILGEDYSGKLVHNEIFPDDYNSGTSPLDWKYRTIKGAEESWNNYQYELQQEYMLTQKLSRFGVTYDITALDIGLDKAKVENYATWGSAGSIYTEKPGEGNIYWVATFSVKPMAGEAKVHSVLDLPNGYQYTIPKDESTIEIPLQFGAYVDGLSEYAKAEHIKLIEAELSVNGISKNIVSGVQTTNIKKPDSLIINKNDYIGQNKIVLELSCNSFMTTYFNGDTVLYDTKTVTVTINIEGEENHKVTIERDTEAPSIYDITIKRVSTDSRGEEIDVDLYTSKRTNTKFICAGQVMKIEVTTSTDAGRVSFDFSGKESIRKLDDLTKKFEWDDPKARNEKTRYSSLNSLKQSYKLPRNLSLEYEDEFVKVFSGIYVIPYGTTQTLHSWNSLRNESKNAFDIDESKLFTRCSNQYALVVKASNSRFSWTKSYGFDVAERWDELYNRDLSKYVRN